MKELVVQSQVGTLNYNLEQLEQEVQSYLKIYKGLVITPDQVKDSKKIRAELNKSKKELNARKIAVKKEFMAPYTEFETQVKNIMKQIDEVSSEIDTQIKNFEQKEKDYKKQAIFDYFEMFGIDYIDFNLIFKEKWLNKSVKTFDWQKEMTSAVDRVKTNLKLIDNRPDADLLKPLYLKSLDLDLALSELEEIQAKQKVILEQETNIALDTGKAEFDPLTGEVVETEEEYLTRSFKVVGTIKQLNELTYFMKENNIYFERSL